MSHTSHPVDRPMLPSIHQLFRDQRFPNAPSESLVLAPLRNIQDRERYPIDNSRPYFPGPFAQQTTSRSLPDLHVPGPSGLQNPPDERTASHSGRLDNGMMRLSLSYHVKSNSWNDISDRKGRSSSRNSYSSGSSNSIATEHDSGYPHHSDNERTSSHVGYPPNPKHPSTGKVLPNANWSSERSSHKPGPPPRVLGPGTHGDPAPSNLAMPGAAGQRPTEDVFSASLRHECSWCGKRFSRPNGLKIHMTMHTGEKPFVCPEGDCGRSFSVRSNMRRHARMHHDLGL